MSHDIFIFIGFHVVGRSSRNIIIGDRIQLSVLQ
jgi:hypothetical protein